MTPDPFCNVNFESVIHALWSCPNAQKVRKKVLFKEVFTRLHFSNYGDLFEVVTTYLSKYEMRLFLYICWNLWQNRNKVVVEGRSCAQEVIFNRAHYLANEYGSLVKGEPKLIIEKPTKWSPPPVGKYKLNVYAAFIPEIGVGGIGAVVRNDKGEVMAAMTFPLAVATSPKHAEIMALHFGMKFARDASFSSFLIESNSQGVVNDIKKDEEESWASDGHLIDDIKRSLQHFEDVTISFSPRGCNQVAHSLARHAFNCNTMVTWIEEVPL
ncbi:uncharacterized protein LOC117630568 [Prunus dulcis]|uniref:uncharacterized protein LOC117630568 n=1 Tax=Prunus dulcis TaxID=3755 RepID=UPI0014827DCA|nr:uncharacterized protein LOC117630568 [Prunus dulcis]